MPDSQAKRDWDKKNVWIVPTKLFRANGDNQNDQQIIDFLQGKQASTIIKLALREYMERHREEQT